MDSSRTPAIGASPGPAASPARLRMARFGDHDELASLIQGGESEFIQRAPGAFVGSFTLLGLDAGMVQFGEMELPYMGRGSPAGDRPVFVLHLRPHRDYVWKGRTLEPGSIIFLPPGSEHQDLSPRNCSWVALTFERPRLERALAGFGAAQASSSSSQSQVLLPRRVSFEALRGRLQAVHHAVRNDPSILESDEARRGMEESILSSLGYALASASRVEPSGYAAASRTRVLRRVEAYLASHAKESFYLADLCAVAGVGERTLRYVFQERYGMSPVRYLRLARLHRVRRALRRAEPDVNTVRAIAHRCGIWHLGRFAHEYRALFNESPLETLKKPRGGPEASLLRPAPPGPGSPAWAGIR